MTDQEINEAVAMKLGYRPNNGQLIWENEQQHVTFFDCEMPDYCHSIEAAWEIVEHLTAVGYSWEVVHIDKGVPGFWCEIANGDWEPKENASANTAPMAICKAFLKLP